MNSSHEQLWPAHEPGRDFAARTAEAMLSSLAVVRPHRSRSRTILYLSIAALLVGGSAWALIEARRHAQPRLELPANVAIVPANGDIALRVQPTAIDSDIVTPPAAAPLRRTTSPVRATKPPPVSSSQVQHPPRNPACECERGFSDFMCDCY